MCLRDTSPTRQQKPTIKKVRARHRRRRGLAPADVAAAARLVRALPHQHDHLSRPGRAARAALRPPAHRRRLYRRRCVCVCVGRVRIFVGVLCARARSRRPCRLRRCSNNQTKTNTTAMGGSLLSMAFEPPCTLYVGASGAVFGFIGALCVRVCGVVCIVSSRVQVQTLDPHPPTHPQQNKRPVPRRPRPQL